jgi:hypothetical protein
MLLKYYLTKSLHRVGRRQWPIGSPKLESGGATTSRDKHGLDGALLAALAGLRLRTGFVQELFEGGRDRRNDVRARQRDRSDLDPGVVARVAEIRRNTLDEIDTS